MSISWGEAYCESNGSPSTLYKYYAEYSNRTPCTVHINLYVSVRMQYYTSYFSFRITHATMVNGVYQDAEIKSTRAFWGHQWEGSYDDVDDFDWWEGSYDYDGSNWHGWYKVFDGDVPVGLDDTTVDIRPCITREPITGDGNPYGTDYPHGENWLDKTNWQGYAGVWRPWRETEYIGSFSWRECPEDGAFMNNRNAEPLEPAFEIPSYSRPSLVDTGKMHITPTKVDVADQKTTVLHVSWQPSSGSADIAGYNIWIGRRRSGDIESRYLHVTTECKFSANPWQAFDGEEIVAGDEFWFSVLPYDRNGIEAETYSRSPVCTYYETRTYGPSKLWITGRRGVDSMIFYRGEEKKDVRIRLLNQHTQKEGSYPIARYELIRASDKKTLKWSSNSLTQPTKDHKTHGYFDISLPFPGVEAPTNKRSLWTLKTYDVKGQPCYPYPKGNGAVGEWPKVYITYYAGTLFVYDADAESWREGDTYVYINGSWKLAEAVYVYKNGSWRTI